MSFYIGDKEDISPRLIRDIIKQLDRLYSARIGSEIMRTGVAVLREQAEDIAAGICDELHDLQSKLDEWREQKKRETHPGIRPE